MTNKFCPLISNCGLFQYDVYAPCCWITRKADIKNPKEVAEYKEWLSNIDAWVPECNFCKDQEDRGIHSPRLSTLDSMNDTNNNDINPDDPNLITVINLQIDAECNAACLMCSEYNSTTWRKYESRHNKHAITIDHDKENKISTKDRLAFILSTVDLSKIKNISFVGGEPLATTTHLDLLKEIQKVKPLNSITLGYTTNGSKMPNAETIEFWKAVGNVSISFSIDGIGEHFNYLRWPLQWNQVEKNIQYFMNLDIPNFGISISSQVSPLNIMYYDRYLEWERTFFKNENERPKFSWAGEVTGVMNNSCIPPLLAEQVRLKYKDQSWLINLMKLYDPEKYQKFMEYVTLHDTQRKINWRTVFPEVSNYFPDQPKDQF